MSEIKQSADSEMMREQFEKWGNAKGTMGASWNGSYYQNDLHNAAWQAWQASRQQTAARCAEIARRVEPSWKGENNSVAAAIRAEFETGGQQ